MALIDDVKKRLRISHDKLDSDLTAAISAARSEMVRIGIKPSAANGEDPLVEEAIKTYVQYKFSSDDKAVEGYFKSWETQVDGLRKSSGYRKAAPNAE